MSVAPCRFTPITEEDEEGPAAAAAAGQLQLGSEDGVKPAEPTDWNSDGEPPSDEAGDGQGQQQQQQGDRPPQPGEAAAATGSGSGVAAAGMLQGNGTQPEVEGGSSSRGRLSAL